MHIKLSERDDVKIFYPEGDIDINTSPQIKKTFDKLSVKQNGKVVINLKGVAYIDSSGLATLVELLKNVRNSGGKLKLCNLSGKVKSLFEITKLEKLFDIVASEDDAVKAF